MINFVNLNLFKHIINLTLKTYVFFFIIFFISIQINLNYILMLFF